MSIGGDTQCERWQMFRCRLGLVTYAIRVRTKLDDVEGLERLLYGNALVRLMRSIERQGGARAAGDARCEQSPSNLVKVGDVRKQKCCGKKTGVFGGEWTGRGCRGRSLGNGQNS